MFIPESRVLNTSTFFEQSQSVSFHSAAGWPELCGAVTAAAAAAVGASVRAQLLIRHALKPMDAGAVSAKI